MTPLGVFAVLYLGSAIILILTMPLWEQTWFGAFMEGCFNEVRKFTIRVLPKSWQ